MNEKTSHSAGKRTALVISIIAAFVGAFMMTGMTIALPDMGRAFSMQAVLLGWVVTAFSLATAAFFLPSGRLADIYGRKRMFLIGMIIFTGASFACYFATSGLWLIICRAVQGVGSAMTASNSIAILTSVFYTLISAILAGLYNVVSGWIGGIRINLIHDEVEKDSALNG